MSLNAVMAPVFMAAASATINMTVGTEVMNLAASMVQISSTLSPLWQLNTAKKLECCIEYQNAVMCKSHKPIFIHNGA